MAGLCDSSATLVFVLFENTDLLKGLEDLSVNGTAGIDVVGWGGTAVLLATVVSAETADTDGLAEVDVTGYGGGADIVPISNI